MGPSSWLEGAEFSAWHPLLRAMQGEEYAEELADAFSRVLPFGTGGRRGSCGVGPNRFNPWTLGTSVEGHCRFLRARTDGPLSVVITYDVRNFQDIRGRYADVPSPLRGMTSRSLAELAARVYAANGVTAWIQPRGDRSYFSTPELSFLIRTLGADAGLMISASHNPPDDNGAKFYNNSGGQLVPPHDQALLDDVVGVQTYQALSWDKATPFLRWLTPEHHQAYVEAVGLRAPKVPAIPVAVTALHGVGRIEDVLRAAGFSVETIESQAVPDGAFPTVPGQVANPERPEVFAHGLSQIKNAKLFFATDPDADRVGCMVWHQEEWVFLSGNQIAALVIDAVLRRWSGPQQPVVIHTEVSSTLLTRVAELHGARVYRNLLVGFKYIGEVMNALDAGCFAVGAEESHGLLVSDCMRDKDAAGGALWLAIAGSDAARRGGTLIDRLTELESEVGVVRNQQLRKTFEGVEGRAQLRHILDGLRAAPPEHVAGVPVVEVVDHQNPAGVHGPIRSQSDHAGRDVIVWRLQGGRLIFRPSGTEPKLKIYIELTAPAGTSSRQLHGWMSDMKRGVCELLEQSKIDAGRAP